MALSTYTYEQLGFGTELGPLTEKEKDALEKSWAAAFASDIFPYIDEQIFSPLFSEKKGKRNVPVNVLAGALLLQEIRGMSDVDLVEAAMFDLRFRTALHITNAVGQPLSLRTIQRFRTRLRKYRQDTGEDLLRICFDRIGDRVSSFLQKYAKNMVADAKPPEEVRGRRRTGIRGKERAEENPEKTIPEKENPEKTNTEKENPEKGFDFAIVADPEIFKVNCLPAHSDHVFFAGEEELERGSREPAGTAGSSVLRHSLNGLWKFAYTDKPADAPEGFETLSYDCRRWTDIHVPAHIQMEGYDVPAYINYQYPWDGREDIIPGEIPERFNPTASYVRYFRIPEAMQAYLEKGSPLFISFQGVESGFALWCNGCYVGYSEDSFTPSEFDLTPFVRKGENKLAVRVFKWTASSWLESQDFFRFSGIFRDVYLYTVPGAHLRDLSVRPTLDETFSEGQLTVEAEILLSGNYRDIKKKKGVLRLYYALTKGSEEILRGAVDVPDAGHNEEGAVSGLTGYSAFTVSISKKIPSPALWSAEDPQLYDLTLRLIDKREAENKDTSAPFAAQEETATEAVPEEKTGQEILLEIVRERVGFRRFEMKDGLMCLNGKRIVFRGVNRHEFTCDSGRVVPPEVTYQDLLLMKQNNINAVRTCHYPNASALYRFCDELGLYLIAENNMESHGSWLPVEAGLSTPGIVPADDTRWRPLLLDRIESCFRRDKNHPSILIWSVGNESFGGTVIRDMADRFRALDSGRLVHYEGIFHDRAWPQSSDMESRMYPSVEAIEAFLQENKDKPFICCEYTHAMGNSCGGMHRYTDLTLREPRYQGGFIWDFVDQSIRAKNRCGEEFQAYGGDFGERPTDYDFSGNGIVDGNRRPYVGKMQEVKFNYQSIRFAVEKDCVRIKNDNLFTGTEKYACTVLLEKEGLKIAECAMETAVAPLSEGVYALPQRISEIIGQIRSEAAQKKTVFEFAVTVSMYLREDCAWAEKGHEIAFGQGIFLTEDEAQGKAVAEVDSFEAAVPGTDSPEAAALETESSGPAMPETDFPEAAVPGTDAFEAAAQEAIEKEDNETVEITGTDWKRTITVQTESGDLELTRGSFNIGIRSAYYDALFSVLQGGLVSFRRRGSACAGGGISGRTSRAFLSGSEIELFEQMPRPCFWRAPTSNDTGCRMAARHGVWKLADEYQIPRPDTLRIFTEKDSVLLKIRHTLPIPGEPSVDVGYRFYADGRLTLSMNWEPVMEIRSEDGASVPALASMPLFGFGFRLPADLDRFTFYGNGPAENYIDRNRGAKLGIYSSSVADNMSPYLVPQECGNRTGVRWASVTDRRGGGVRFTAGDLYISETQVETEQERVVSERLGTEQKGSRRAAMEFSALPYSAQELERASHPYELPPVHFTNVRCALLQMGIGGDDSWGAQTLPQYCLPADRELHFEVTLEII